jgi:hypothetical protein
MADLADECALVAQRFAKPDDETSGVFGDGASSP